MIANILPPVVDEQLDRTLRDLRDSDEPASFKNDICGHPIFKVSEDEFSKCKSRRAKYERWGNFFQEDSPNYKSIRKYSNKNPNKPLVIQNNITGETTIFRRRLNDQRLKYNKRRKSLGK